MKPFYLYSLFLIPILCMVAPAAGQVDPDPAFPDSVYIQGEILVGEIYLPNGGGFGWSVGTFPDSTFIRGFSVSRGGIGTFDGRGTFNYGGYGWRIGGFSGKFYELIQMGTADSEVPGHLFLRFDFESDNNEAIEAWNNFVKNATLYIGSVALPFADGFPGRRGDRIAECDDYYMVFGVCWPNKEVLLRSGAIEEISISADSTFRIISPPQKIRYLTVQTNSQPPGSVVLMFLAARPEIGAHYEYKVLRDGDGTWQRFDIKDTIVSGRTREYTVTGLSSDGVYSFCIRAVNSAGVSPETCNLDKIYPVSTESGRTACNGIAFTELSESIQSVNGDCV